MKILVLCGDRWHPPELIRAGLDFLSGVEITFDYIEDANDWSPEIMQNYPGVILTKSNNVSATDQTEWMTDSTQAAFAEYVSNGNGLLAIHSGTAEYEHKTVLRDLLGGVFVQHPEQCPVKIEPKAKHPLCKEIDPFTITDEHYFMALDDLTADVFMVTRSIHGVQPGGWQREVGNGRIAVLTPGHNLEVWMHPSFQALLLSSLRWCCKRL